MSPLNIIFNVICDKTINTKIYKGVCNNFPEKYFSMLRKVDGVYKLVGKRYSGYYSDYLTLKLSLDESDFCIKINYVCKDSNWHSYVLRDLDNICLKIKQRDGIVESLSINFFVKSIHYSRIS